MKTVDGLLREFDLNVCEDLSLKERLALSQAFMTGMSAGISLIMVAFKESSDLENGGFKRELLAPRFESLIAQMEEQILRLRKS